MSLRDRLGEIPVGTELLRGVRFLTDDELAELTPEEIEAATRWLRAAAYSATAGAHRLERHAARQAPNTEQEPSCSPYDPNVTATSTDTAGARPATTKRGRRSPSTSPYTAT